MGRGSGGYKEEPAPVAGDPVSYRNIFPKPSKSGYPGVYSQIDYTALLLCCCISAFASGSWPVTFSCAHEHRPFVAQFIVHGMRQLPRHYRTFPCEKDQPQHTPVLRFMLWSFAPDVYTQPCILPLKTLNPTVLDPVCFVSRYRLTLSIALHDPTLDRGHMVQNVKNLNIAP